MIRAEIQAELDATREAMARLRVAVMSTQIAIPARAERPESSGLPGKTAAERLRTFRKSQGLSQRVLGRQIGVAQGYITNIETGRSEPSREFARKLAETYGVSADWLLFGRGVA